MARPRRIMRMWQLLCFLALSLGGIICSPVRAYADVKIRIVAANPLDEQKQKTSIRYNLPAGIKREDIIDAGGLEVDYNVEKDLYYVYTEADLAPKETRTFQIVLRDIWYIPPSDIDALRNKLQEKLVVLEKTESAQTAQMLANTINAKLDSITKDQTEAGQDVEKRIGLYKTNLQLLSRLENDILSLEYLANKSGDLQNAKVIRYFVESTNPTEKPLETTVTHLLPKGVMPEYLVTNPDFEIIYDKDKDQYYVSKDEKLAPKESKRYEIEIKDMWYFPDKFMTTFLDDAESLDKFLEDTKYKKLSIILRDEIKDNVTAVQDSQKSVGSLKDKIALYQTNTDRVKAIQNNINRLNNLVATVVRDQEFHTVLKEREPAAQLKVADFKKQIISKVATWKIILYMVIFITVFAILSIFALRKLGKTGSGDYKKIEKKKYAPPKED